MSEQQNQADDDPSAHYPSSADTTNSSTILMNDTANKKVPLLVERIQWLNQVTTQVTEELNEVHPPPLRDMVDSVMSSEISKDIQGVTHVVGGVVGDLKDGFVGLHDTIRHMNDQDSNLLLKKSTKMTLDEEPKKTEEEQVSGPIVKTPSTKNSSLAAASAAATASSNK